MTIFVADEEYFTVQISIISSGGGGALGAEGMIKHSILYPQASLGVRLRSDHIQHQQFK